MGWASGCEIAEDIWKVIKPYISEKDLETVATKIHKIFDENDADDWYMEDGNLDYYYIKQTDPELFEQWMREE